MSGHYGDGKYGDGDFAGNPVASNPLNLHVIKKTDLLITLGWTPPGGCDGYLFFKNGNQVSRTFDGTVTQTHFSYKTGDTFIVKAIRITELVSAWATA